jgi:hypothetical protein
MVTTIMFHMFVLFFLKKKIDQKKIYKKPIELQCLKKKPQQKKKTNQQH